MKRFLDFSKNDDELQIIRETVEEDVKSPEVVVEKIIETKEIKEVVTSRHSRRYGTDWTCWRSWFRRIAR